MANWYHSGRPYDAASFIAYSSSARPSSPEPDEDAQPKPLSLDDILVHEYAHGEGEMDAIQANQDARPTREGGHQRTARNIAKYEPDDSPSIPPAQLSSDSAVWKGSKYSVENYHQAPWMPGPFPNRGAETTVSSSGYFQFPGSHRPGVSSAVGHHGYGYHAPPTPPYTPRTVPQSLAPMRGPPVIHIPTDYSPPSNSHDRFAISRGTNRPPVALPPTSLHDVEDPASEFMRARLRIPAGHPVSLYSIPDTTDGSRPGIPLRDLIGLAICGSERKMLTLQGIVHAISGRFSFYASAVNEPGWKNSIRHALSLYKIFVLQPRDDGDPGMGGYWRMIIGAGDGYARPRHRTKGSPPHQAQQALPKKQNLNLKHNEDEDSDDEDESDDHSATRPSAASSSTQTGTGKARMLTRSSTKARRL